MQSRQVIDCLGFFCSAAQILPVAVRNILDKRVRLAIIKMNRVFQKLCAKEVRLEDKDDMMRCSDGNVRVRERISNDVPEHHVASASASS